MAYPFVSAAILVLFDLLERGVLDEMDSSQSACAANFFCIVGNDWRDQIFIDVGGWRGFRFRGDEHSLIKKQLPNPRNYLRFCEF